MLNNAHVYLYFRWKAFVARKLNRPMAEEFNLQWAEWEKNGWPKEF